MRKHAMITITMGFTPDPDDAFAAAPGHHVLEGLAELPRGLPAAFVEVLIVPAAEQHPGERRIPAGGVQQPAGDAGEPIRDRMVTVGLRLFYQTGAPALRVAVHLVEEVLLPAEMAVDGAFRHPGARGDRRGRRGPEADGGVEVECGAEQALTGGLTVATSSRWIGHEL